MCDRRATSGVPTHVVHMAKPTHPGRANRTAARMAYVAGYTPRARTFQHERLLNRAAGSFEVHTSRADPPRFPQQTTPPISELRCALAGMFARAGICAASRSIFVVKLRTLHHRMRYWMLAPMAPRAPQACRPEAEPMLKKGHWPAGGRVQCCNVVPTSWLWLCKQGTHVNIMDSTKMVTIPLAGSITKCQRKLR